MRLAATRFLFLKGAFSTFYSSVHTFIHVYTLGLEHVIVIRIFIFLISTLNLHNRRTDRRRRRRPDTESSEPDVQAPHVDVHKESPSHISESKPSASINAAPSIPVPLKTIFSLEKLYERFAVCSDSQLMTRHLVKCSLVDK